MKSFLVHFYEDENNQQASIEIKAESLKDATIIFNFKYGDIYSIVYIELTDDEK